jgi:hypothetical protein
MKILLNEEFPLEEDEKVLFDAEKPYFQPYDIIVLAVLVAVGFVNGPNPFLLAAAFYGMLLFMGRSKTRVWVTSSRLITAEKSGVSGRYEYKFAETAKIVGLQKGSVKERKVSIEEQVARMAQTNSNLKSSDRSNSDSDDCQRQNANLAFGRCDVTIHIDGGGWNHPQKKWTLEALKDGHQFIAKLAALLGFTSPDGFVWFNPKDLT